MALTTKQRQALREKFGGRCAYCGCKLGERWHADHIDPVIRNDWIDKHRGPDHPERDVIGNMNPACPACNIDKHSMSLETWRGVIGRSNDVLMRDVATFRRAVRYGLINLNNDPVVFFFEKEKAQ